ncbi:MAG: hypothetical protein JSW72_03845 [Candidatus Bathyarchaeota archaeon]|nr:MAG: hypothetical protein JSW72_03845 [Candidatus Bathyarchaeota archaeon]
MSVRLRKSSKKILNARYVSISKPDLIKLRIKARRRGTWFRALSRIERGLMDLTIKVVESVRSVILARSLISVAKKLLDALESEVAFLIKTVGPSLAQKLSEIAQSWGNDSAKDWAKDQIFIRYLSVMRKNLSSIFSA